MSSLVNARSDALVDSHLNNSKNANGHSQHSESQRRMEWFGSSLTFVESTITSFNVNSLSGPWRKF